MQCDNIISVNSFNQFPIDQLQQYKWIKNKKQCRKVHSTMSRNTGTTFPPIANLFSPSQSFMITNDLSPIVIRFDSIKLLKKKRFINKTHKKINMFLFILIHNDFFLCLRFSICFHVPNRKNIFLFGFLINYYFANNLRSILIESSREFIQPEETEK